MGASLLAIAVCQLHQGWMYRRYREQARSHTGNLGFGFAHGDDPVGHRKLRDGPHPSSGSTHA
ncbi:hypothetical protein EMIT043CA1_140131 [Pseudomonas brassicacearum]